MTTAKMDAADAKLRCVIQEIREVIAEHEEWRFRVEAASRAVVEMRKHDAVAVLAATNVLLTEILGAGVLGLNERSEGDVVSKLNDARSEIDELEAELAGTRKRLAELESKR